MYRKVDYEVHANLELKTSSKYFNGIYKDLCDLIGEENTQKVYKEYRGQQITFPVEFYSKEYIYSQIIDEFNGSNLKQLATKYGYSERTIRRILKA